LDDGSVTSQGTAEFVSGVDDGAGSSSDRGVVVGGFDIDQGMFDEHGPFEGEERGSDGVDDDHLGGDEEAVKLTRSHRFRAVAGGLVDGRQLDLQSVLPHE
jgi:hypothetical protein